MLQPELQRVPDEVLSNLPSQPALVRAMQRIRRKEVLPAPTKLWYLKEIPDRYKKTLLNEQFLLHDSSPFPKSFCIEDPSSKEMPKEEADPKVIVSATQKNIESMCHNSIWFVDGTFRIAPNIFAQIFTIIGLRKHTGHSEEVVAVPLLYAFLSGKKTELYKEVLQVVKDAVKRFHTAPCVPTKIMSDFKFAIINVCTEVFPGVPLSCCCFHLGQITYRRV